MANGDRRFNTRKQGEGKKKKKKKISLPMGFTSV
jgi:hypothetical protein